MESLGSDTSQVRPKNLCNFHVSRRLSVNEVGAVGVRDEAVIYQ